MSEPMLEQTPACSNLSSLIIVLLKGVLYQENDVNLWADLLNLQAQVRDYIAVIGLELALDEAEGYAFLRAHSELKDDPASKLPRLVVRRQLSFSVSLLLALLRKKLAEFDASGGQDGNGMRLVLNRNDIIELIRVFLPSASNDAKLTDQIETHINKIVELGFLRKLKASNPSMPAAFEVRRIIKAFVDAQWLAEFDAQLDAYQIHLTATQEEDE
ncbi:DUF4194 domain-containing protein [Solimicrobium silvestre]|uniref:DUF4194 domain-containing protein n=1 Tax=Solimicrobium silvestre TaxID=2099400 RepID=A0A2S9GTR1_9BURK|nr:DUF4194 domain-containing protein [Solimicrobium silvestre]PRC91088.1 hypothetical protein S2091_4184 [Solimicrobium silvestre]